MSQDGNLGVTLSTWLYLLFEKGQPIVHPGILAACQAIRDMGPGDDANAVGQALVSAVRLGLGAENPGFAEVVAAVRGWLGPGVLATDLGTPADREERIRAVRRYQFSRRLPWIARVIDRFPDGVVGEHWVMIQDLEEDVHIMDPYPWDGVDEEYRLPLVDFMVKWELAGRESLRIL